MAEKTVTAKENSGKGKSRKDRDYKVIEKAPDVVPEALSGHPA